MDWNSSEKMSQVEGYRTGAEVEYNQQPTVAGRGSCIFLHIWSGRGIGTAGCTAMSEEDAMLVMQWIDDRTVLVQLPQRDYEGMKGAYKLP